MPDRELIFEVSEDELEGGYTARALGYSIFTEADTIDELRDNVREATDAFFDETMETPKVIRLHFVRDELLAR
ncbi:MAG: 2-oxoisovalerate dehydrogenase [Verrucomicrobiota bacterium]|nr:2-oxoisovalerate dehydrogenase [Verrucomicrobiota bacterium]MDP6251508.1 2-oxoisovalerate dehydrogenase [Verrucomicrobiota bacterium]MDP7290744.1 2-oxoisovalerate dehydrogenase [Verrucomicrobiota bacterium]MDP7441779.1 2-oxoisovalerate dehydrogenase [Verrucomicrobiota bacterium]HJN81466.1 2-oxoisovalerate dehydrogenase [Verrucomicrobiota bacterium]